MRIARTLVLASGVLLTGCGGEGVKPSPECPPVRLSGGVYATFQVAEDRFHAWITDPAAIEQAIALWEGQSTATFPAGRLVCAAVSWNCPWSWHIDPNELRFVETAVELCDGRPSLVEASCPNFGGGTYCPWAAQLVELRDCRSDTSCPALPR